MTELQLKEIHNLSMNNRERVEESIICGCFQCRRIFNPQEKKVVAWVDDNDTALCPFCGIDSVISQSEEYPITPDLLTEMHKKWF